MTEKARTGLVAIGGSLVGSSYVSPNPSPPDSFDCSSFIAWLVQKTRGVSLKESAWCLSLDLPVVESPLPGDVVVYRRRYQRQPSDSMSLVDQMKYQDNWEYHVMLYLGHDRILGACPESRAVKERSLEYDKGNWRLILQPYRSVVGDLSAATR